MKKRIKEFFKKIFDGKDKYYWKRKYYQLHAETQKVNTRNEILSEDLRNTYARSKHYENLYFGLIKDMEKK